LDVTVYDEIKAVCIEAIKAAKVLLLQILLAIAVVLKKRQRGGKGEEKGSSNSTVRLADLPP